MNFIQKKLLKKSKGQIVLVLEQLLAELEEVKAGKKSIDDQIETLKSAIKQIKLS